VADHAAEAETNRTPTILRPRSGVDRCQEASATRAGNKAFPSRPQLALGLRPKAADNTNAASHAKAGRVTGFRNGVRSRSPIQIGNVAAAHMTAVMDMGAIVHGRVTISSRKQNRATRCSAGFRDAFGLKSDSWTTVGDPSRMTLSVECLICRNGMDNSKDWDGIYVFCA
jgi:hypothetical protein